MRTLFLCLCLGASLVVPCSAVTFPELESNLSGVDVLRAQYRQTRFISGLDAPLDSSGTLLLVRNKGVVWSQVEPFQVQFVLTDEMIAETFGDQPRKIKSKADHGELFRFVGFFSSIFDGDKAALEKTFKIDFVSLNDDRWEMNLTPNIAKIKKVFSGVKLQGRLLVEDVEIVEASGNRTVIHFDDLSTSPTVLSIDEKQYFAN